jgi:aryl-phospho-beta-D-glucosidase BglC (GH1 family)
VLLKGVNIESLEWNPLGERVMRNTLVAIDDWQANIIRLPVKEEYWFDAKVGDGYKKLVDNIVMLAANRGAYVLLDLHRFGAPKQAHVDFWKDAAARYKNHPAVIFDLFNEPHSISWDIWKNGGFVADKNAPADEDNFLTPEEKALNAKGYHSVGMQALVDAARSTGAKNIVVVGGLDWAYDASGMAKGFALEDKGGNGIMVATHIYAGKKDWQNKVLAVADKYPIIVSEFGANTEKFSFIPADQQEDAATWVPKIFGFIQKHNFNWTAFAFHPKSGPHMLTGWDYTPTPEWGAFVKRALAGEQFPDKGMR